MKLISTICIALLLETGHSIGAGSTRSRTFSKIWSSHSAQTDFLDPATQVHDRLLLHGESLSRTQTDALDSFSENKKNRKDPYAPESGGAATVDDWCSHPEVHDPACMANPVAMTMQEEINAVMQHLKCSRKPEECLPKPAPSEEKKASQENHQAVAKAPAPAEQHIGSAPAPSEQHQPVTQGTSSKDDVVAKDESFREAAKAKYGDSDQSFKHADMDHNGELSEVEFQDQCQTLGVYKEACGDLMEGMTGGKGTPVSEANYKDAIGATPAEIARRMRVKYATPQDAFESGDIDNDGSLSDSEIYGQCLFVAPSEACRDMQRRLGGRGGVSKESYKAWMQTGAVPTQAAPSTALRAPATGGDPKEASKKINGLVEQLESFMKTQEEQGKLDPELEKAVSGMIKTGKKAAGAMDKFAKLGHEEGGHELDELVQEADDLDAAVFKFQTEVHPHGYKWWRYRWEYSFVEANILNLLVFVTMLLYLFIHWVTSKMAMFSHVLDTEGSSVVNLYHSIFIRGMHELNVLGAIAFCIWGLEECGLFMWIVQFLPAKGNPVNAVIGMTNAFHQDGHDQHWPTTDQHVIYTARSVNMHLFLGMLLYYLLMYHISFGAICILEQFMRHECPEFYGRFIEHGYHSEDFTNKPEEVKARAWAVHAVLSNKGPLGEFLSSDSTFAYVFGHFHTDEDYENLKAYVAVHVKYHEGFEELHDLLSTVPLYPYLAKKLHVSLESMIFIDWRVWLLVQVVLLGQALVHYFLHVAVVELLPIAVGVGSCILAFQFIWTRRNVAYVVDKAHQASCKEEGRTTAELEARESREKWLLYLQQLNLFFLCFSAARLLFSSFFWSDYFRLSCCMLVLFLALYVVMATIGALTVPMFIIMMAVPPHVTKKDREEMKTILKAHHAAGIRQHGMEALGVSPLSRERRCATGISII